MNIAETSALKLILKERNWEQAGKGENADLVLINTCSVRATAERRFMGRLAEYNAQKKKRPLKIVVAGCVASRLGEKLKTKGADYVIGTDSRSLFPHILKTIEENKTFLEEKAEKPVFSFSPFHYEKGEFRSFIPIMHGCNNFCSYCIVPYLRGREISRDPASIIAEIKLLAEKGVREITLLGQNVNSYYWEGKEKVDFPLLLELIAKEVEKSPIHWIRFLSSHPKDLSLKAIEVMAQYKVFCRHIHLCVQSGSNRILSKMNRKYTREEYLSLVSEIRRAMPEISLSTDILIGFPSETEKDLEETLDLMEEVRFLYAYMYHYNPREGTEAFNMPDRIDDDVKRKRLLRVIEIQAHHTLELLKTRIGSCEKVLVEGISRKNADELITRTERDEVVVVSGNSSMIGKFAEVTISSLKGKTFRAKEFVLCYD